MPTENQTAPKNQLSKLDIWTIKAWRIFMSIKFGLFLLTVIMIVCIYGTMFYAANSTLGDNAIPLGKAKVFNAPWFFALLAFFFVQFVMSTWRVTVMSTTLYWKKEFKKSKIFFTGKKTGRAEVSPKGGLSNVLPMLQKRFTVAHANEDGTKFFAHTGLRQRIGPTVIHFGIITILLAGLARIILDVGGYITSEGRFVAEEGETSNFIVEPRHYDQVMGPSNIKTVSLNHDIRVLDFDEIFHPNSDQPKYFSSLLEIRDRETNEVDVVKVDMNHSVKIEGYDFHQASYVPIPPIENHRTDFDVRDAVTGERIAVADASPDTRVQVADENLFLEVDGEAPGTAWRLYNAQSPLTPIAEGTLLAKAARAEIAIRPIAFFPEFGINRDTGPYSISNNPLDPALQVEVLEDGMSVGQTLLFVDPEKASVVPPISDYYTLSLEDVSARQGLDSDFADYDWSDPANSFFTVGLTRTESGTANGEWDVALQETSPPMEVTLGTVDEMPPPGADYAVYPLGKSTRYITVLSVVREPVTPFFTIGVAVIFFGALMTFSGRYRAFYGMWDEEAQTLRVALVPRHGKHPDPEEFEELVGALQGVPNPPPTETEKAPVPATAT